MSRSRITFILNYMPHEVAQDIFQKSIVDAGVGLKSCIVSLSSLQAFRRRRCRSIDESQYLDMLEQLIYDYLLENYEKLAKIDIEREIKYTKIEPIRIINHER